MNLKEEHHDSSPELLAKPQKSRCTNRRKEVRVGYLRKQDLTVHKVYYSVGSHRDANDIRVSTVRQHDMSPKATVTPYQFVLGKTGCFRLSRDDRLDLIERDKDRRAVGDMEECCVCDGCGKEKTILNGNEICLRGWFSHKLRCHKLQALLREEFERSTSSARANSSASMENDGSVDANAQASGRPSNRENAKGKTSPVHTAAQRPKKTRSQHAAEACRPLPGPLARANQNVPSDAEARAVVVERVEQIPGQPATQAELSTPRIPLKATTTHEGVTTTVETVLGSHLTVAELAKLLRVPSN